MKGKSFVVRIAVAAIVAGMGFVLFEAWWMVQRSVISPNVIVAGVDIGARSRKNALAELERAFNRFEQQGVRITIDGYSEEISLSSLGAQWDAEATLERALNVGRAGSAAEMLRAQLASIWLRGIVDAAWSVDEEVISTVIDDLEAFYSTPRKDIRFVVDEGTLRVATDTMAGRSVDRAGILRAIGTMLNNWDHSAITLPLL